MSFIKKGLQKAWDFVKKYWVQIVMVAAIVFTAGIATVGVAGFSAAMAAGGGGVGGFFTAVGSTMWAGVTATAGTIGIGQGAAVGAGTNFAAAGIAGGASHVGLGAAMGAGGGYGLGAAGKAAAAQAAAAKAGVAVEASSAIGVEGTGINVGAQETSRNMAAELGNAGLKEGATEVSKAGVRNMAADLGAKTAATEGMSTAQAMMWSTALSSGGSMLSGWAQGKAMEDQMKAQNPLAYWGVATKKGGRTGPVDDYLFEGAVMQPLAGEAVDPDMAVAELMQEQMGAPQQRAMGGALMTQPGQPVQFATTDPSLFMNNNSGYKPLMEMPVYG
jgi:hypothetical protein